MNTITARVKLIAQDLQFADKCQFRELKLPTFNVAKRAEHAGNPSPATSGNESRIISSHQFANICLAFLLAGSSIGKMEFMLYLGNYPLNDQWNLTVLQSVQSE